MAQTKKLALAWPSMMNVNLSLLELLVLLLLLRRRALQMLLKHWQQVSPWESLASRAPLDASSGWCCWCSCPAQL